MKNKDNFIPFDGPAGSGCSSVILREPRHCEQHGEYVALVVNGRAGGCPKCFEARDAERARDEFARAKRDKIAAAVEAIGIPKRYGSASVSSFAVGGQHAPKQEAVKNVAEAYLNDWERARDEGRSMLFVGSPGTGKTLLACGLAADIVRRYGGQARYASLLDIVGDVKYAWAIRQPDDMALCRYIDADLLVIDEVSARYGTDAESLLLYRIVNKRYEQVKPTILISNLTSDETREAIGAPTLDRLREGGGVRLVFDWPSFRGR